MIHAAGRGKPYLNLQDGRKMGIDYRGDSALAEVLCAPAPRNRERWLRRTSIITGLRMWWLAMP